MHTHHILLTWNSNARVAASPQAELHHQLLSAEEAWAPRVAAAQREARAAEACLWQGRLAAAQQALQAAASRAERLQVELQSARAGVPWSPRAQEVSGTDLLPVHCAYDHSAAGILAYIVCAVDAMQLLSQQCASLTGLMLAAQDGEWQAACCSTSSMPKAMLPA